MALLLAIVLAGFFNATVLVAIEIRFYCATALNLMNHPHGWKMDDDLTPSLQCS